MSTDEQAIRMLIARWLQATRDGDVDAVLALMAPDVIFLLPGQAPILGRDAFGRNLRDMLAGHTIASDGKIEEVVVTGELAYCRTQLAVTVTARHHQVPVRRSGHTLSILRKGSDGQWLLTRDANLLGAPA